MSRAAYRALRGAVPDELRPSVDRLVTEHLWLINARGRALAFRPDHPLWEDAYQDAAVALLKAAERFDPRRKIPFEHYARVWIDNSLKETLCQLGPVKIPVGEAMARIKRGERATAQGVSYQESRDPGASTETEDDLLDLLHTARLANWLTARLGELPANQAKALRGMAEFGTVQFAVRCDVDRHTVQRAAKPGLEYLRAEARGDELEL